MKFSILIAHYNNWDYFQDCYQSIFAQTYPNFEIVIVDDCSTDDSFEKLKKLSQSDNRIKLFQNHENRGVGFTKRKCVEMASGEICGFVDPDDAIVENALELSIQEYKKKDEIVATHSQFNLCNERLEFIKKFTNTTKVKNKNPKFFNIHFEVNHFFTFRKSVYDKTEGINPNLTSAVDQDLYLKIYEQGNIQYIEEALYNYRLHEKGVSQEKSKKQKLNKNWDIVLRESLKRRNLGEIYGQSVNEIDNLPKFIFEKENTLLRKLIRKFS